MVEASDSPDWKPGDKVMVRATASGGVYIEKAGAKDDYRERLYALSKRGLIRDAKNTDEIMRELRGDPGEDPGFNSNVRPSHDARRK